MMRKVKLGSNEAGKEGARGRFQNGKEATLASICRMCKERGYGREVHKDIKTGDLSEAMAVGGAEWCSEYGNVGTKGTHCQV